VLSIKGRRDFAGLACFDDDEIVTQEVCCGLRIFRVWLGYRIIRIDEEAYDGRLGHNFVQQFDLLWRQLAEQKGYPRDVATRSRKARDNAKFDRIAAHRENHRNCVGHNRPGIDDRSGAASRYEETHAMPNQICRRRSICPSAKRDSMATFCPST
jgi:hypothetical protein